ncbi:hypothetical protein ONZ45_g17856 [Pleurotus djamor]|nr:hypothetical protein ONZ45_g17856 [Pleurotus djamor]
MATFTTYAEAAQQQSSQAAAAAAVAAALSSGSHTNGASTSSTVIPIASTSNVSDQQNHTNGGTKGDDEGGKKKKPRRRKVNHACLYCRRSHMVCDEGRPCQRCIKREIGHLCHDEQRSKSGDNKQATTIQASPSAPSQKPDSSRVYAVGSSYTSPSAPPTTTTTTTSPAWPMTGPFLYQPETLGNEFSVLTDFLETLDERSFFTPPPTVSSSLMAPTAFPPTAMQHDSTVGSSFLVGDGTVAGGTIGSSITSGGGDLAGVVTGADGGVGQSSGQTTESTDANSTEDSAPPVILPAATKTEKFLLTAADQESGSRDERLNRVIRSKYEAGLLKPYNYVKGYARLSRWMDRNVSQESKSQILQPLSVLRPKFRVEWVPRFRTFAYIYSSYFYQAVAQSLKDIDLVFIEEAFERMLLDYDRVFSAMGVPACLWRRTGEIYKANREFAELVGIDGYMMRDGRLCIYELMAEESAVNYWEKYGHVAFDSSQKAVLTSCVLRYKPTVGTYPGGGGMMSTPAKGSAAANAAISNSNGAAATAANGTAKDGGGSGGVVKMEEEEDEEIPQEEGFINCCFSFTIRRDKWGIPSMIVGNFIKC